MKESSLRSPLGFPVAIDSNSWEYNGKQILFSRVAVPNEIDLNEIREKKCLYEINKIKEEIVELSSLLDITF